MRFEGFAFGAATCIAVWVWWCWKSSKAPAGPGSSNRGSKHPSSPQPAACESSSGASVTASPCGDPAAPPCSSAEPPAPVRADQVHDASVGGSSGSGSASDEHSDPPSLLSSSPSTSEHAERVLVDAGTSQDSPQAIPTGGAHPVSASSCPTPGSSTASSSICAAAPLDADQGQLAASVAASHAPVGPPAAAPQAPGKQTSPVSAAAQPAPHDMHNKETDTAGPEEACAAVLLPLKLPAGVEGSMFTPAPTPAPVAVAAAAGAESAASAGSAAGSESAPQWQAPRPVSLPDPVSWFHFWVLQLAVLGDALFKNKGLEMAALVCHALWPTAARHSCSWFGHMRTLSGIGVPPTTGPAQKKKKKKKKNPQQPPPTNCELKESHRMDYTRRVWALRLLVAGLWRAAQKAVASGLKEGRLDLATATVVDLKQLTWAAYRPGQERPAWAPGWELQHDVAGLDVAGQQQTYYMPELVSQESDLQQVVIQQADGGAWLLKQYQDLAAMTYSRDDPRLTYPFLRVDTQQQQLVLDLDELYKQVAGWSRAARDHKRIWVQGGWQEAQS